MTRIILLLLAPWGFQCPQTTHDYDDDVASARAAWMSDMGLPADECGTPSVVVRDLHCDTTCYTGARVGDTLYVDESWGEDAAHTSARHETIHWLAACTGYQVNGDPGHSMPELWGAGGVLERAQEVP